MKNKAGKDPYEPSARYSYWARKRADDQALKALAVSLRTLRKDRKLSGHELAGRVGCTLKGIYHIERGENWPSMPLYLALCREFGYPVPPMF